MLSRISSFSGPISKLFTSIKDFTLPGLILRYELRDDNSYTGNNNTVTDLIGNSNATLTNGPTFSSNGYLNLDGVNDYLLTNTSLNSKLSPVNTSTVISYFIWIFPKDNGVIVSELGQTSPNTGWHDSQIEIVSGVLKFGLWTVSGLDSFSSSVSVTLKNWYYVGLTYDGTTLRGYVNGQLAGSKTVNRWSPYNNGGLVGLYYAIGAADSTSLGDGTAAKIKLGAFHIYKTSISNQQVLNNYNAQKSNYIHTNNLVIYLDANDPESYSGGGTTINDMIGTYNHTMTNAPFTILNGIKCFDCNGGVNTYIRVNGTGPTLSTSGYTYTSWAKIKSSSSGYRTLFRSNPNDHPILTQIGNDNLGFWDNDINIFSDSGYDVTSVEDIWVQYSVVGSSTFSTFYINGDEVGSTNYGAGGNKHDYWGSIPGQPFGYVANMMLYDTKLTKAQIKQNYDALKHVYESQIVSDGLLLRLDAGETLSYPGSGTTWYDIAGTQQNMTLVNSPTFVSAAISYFDFNGINQYATGTGITVPTTAYTKSVWVWIDAYGDNNIVSGFNGVGGHFLFMGSAIYNKVFVGHHNQGVAFTTYGSTATISLNTWYNITVTFNTTSGFKIYINGQLDSSHNMTLAHLGSETTNLSSYSNAGGNYLNGRISKVYTYNRPLTSSEVLQNYNADKSLYGL